MVAACAGILSSCEKADDDTNTVYDMSSANAEKCTIYFQNTGKHVEVAKGSKYVISENPGNMYNQYKFTKKWQLASDEKTIFNLKDTIVVNNDMVLVADYEDMEVSKPKFSYTVCDNTVTFQFLADGASPDVLYWIFDDNDENSGDAAIFFEVDGYGDKKAAGYAAFDKPVSYTYDLSVSPEPHVILMSYPVYSLNDDGEYDDDKALVADTIIDFSKFISADFDITVRNVSYTTADGKEKSVAKLLVKNSTKGGSYMTLDLGDDTEAKTFNAGTLSYTEYEYQYAKAGVYTVTATVFDKDGNSTVKTADVKVSFTDGSEVL